MPSSDSVAFDRAAEYYDRTRGTTAEHDLRTTRLLAGELRGRGRVLEVGVGTGQVSLPLHAEGIAMMGIDLSRAMLAKLVEKAGGTPPFPLVRADAVGMPFGDDRFGACVLRWVLHLIPDWREALRETARVVRPGGLLLILLGGIEGPWEDVRRRVGREAGHPVDAVGLGWGRYDLLDDALAELGAARRELPPILVANDEPLGAFIDAVERNLFSWTWPIPEDARLAALPAVRQWATERFGPLDRVVEYEFEVVWRAYDLP
ncbi:MAG TPA: class I SAM-dependent methyltransferase [Actinomycetota bacterium]